MAKGACEGQTVKGQQSVCSCVSCEVQLCVVCVLGCKQTKTTTKAKLAKSNLLA